MPGGRSVRAAVLCNEATEIGVRQCADDLEAAQLIHVTNAQVPLAEHGDGRIGVGALALAAVIDTHPWAVRVERDRFVTVSCAQQSSVC
eukprot:1573374-Prymnesium_polylepis.1